MTPWHLLLGVALACGAFVPGPCSFDPQRRFDCSAGDACDENFACATDGYCKSADIACTRDLEVRCEVPGLERVGLCVREADLPASKTHCGGCFQRCLGAGTCVDGACQGAPAAGRCALSRGNFDCDEGEGCVDDGDGDDEGDCAAAATGRGQSLEGCDSGADCEGGLCAEGLCTRTCDFGCPLGTACDDDAVAGGLCVPTGDEICR